MVWAVVIEPGGLFGIWFSEDRAREAARAVNGALISLEIAEDYRQLSHRMSE